MYKQFIIVALVGTLSLLPFVIDNTDYDPWREGDSYIMSHDGELTRISRSHPDWQPQSAYDEHHENLYKEQELRRKAELKNLFASTQNVCTNGKDASKLSYVDYINAFIAGPCAPVITTPGIIGTALQVTIDCETLQTYAPEIFSNCGWSTCSAAKFWLKKPANEYRMWIGLSTSPLTIVMGKKDKCFGDFIELHYDPSQPIPRDRYTGAPGIQITWVGNTPETKEGAECGSIALQEITNDSLIKLAMCDIHGYHSINDLFKNMGYIPGLTMQGAPYDFRLSIAASETQVYIKNAINNFHRITGKRSYLIGHSLGSLHSTNALYEMSQEDKDLKVAGVMAIGGPLLGATKTFKPSFGGDDSYLINLLVMNTGLNLYSQQKMVYTASSVVDLYPKDAFIRFRNEPWMQEILNRMALDAEFQQTGQFPTTNVPLAWFPPPTQNCGANLEDRPNNCLLMMQDLSEYFLSVAGKTYDANEEQLRAAVSDNIPEVPAQRLLQFIDETKRQKAIDVQHPGVPVIILYGAHSKGTYQLTYKKNPKDVLAETNDFYFPEEISMAVGDGTVVASSSMTPGIKWVWEHKNGQTVYPTKMVEYCSELNGDAPSTIYDTLDTKVERHFTESGYLGLKCQCRNGDVKIDKCGHACMISDPLLVEFLADFVQHNEPSQITQTEISEAELKNIVETCANVN